MSCLITRKEPHLRPLQATICIPGRAWPVLWAHKIQDKQPLREKEAGIVRKAQLQANKGNRDMSRRKGLLGYEVVIMPKD